MTGKTLGHYEVLEKLGAGGMGEVYKAKDTHLDRFVAIKILRADRVADAERTRRFVLEAKSASALNHPNIVTIHDIAHADGVDYIVMEFVAGRTLDRMIGKGGLKIDELLRYAVQAADALARAHAAGIVHRDLKPANIMVTADGRVKIVDFGLAKLAPTASAGSDETTIQHDQVGTGEGWIVGTPAYMSPEQAEGKPVDARSDIFSFGAVLYEMATGASAFRGESPASTLAAVLTTTPAPPSQTAPHVPRALERVIVRCLRKEPSRRFQGMADLALELDEIKSESGERIEPAKAVPAARSKWPLVAAAAGVLVLIAAGAAWWRWPAATVAGPSAIVPLTTYRGVEQMPSLSPDGTQVAFVWTGDRQDSHDIYIKPVDAVTPLRLTSDPLEDAWPTWSPSGRQIAFARETPTGGAVYVTPLVPGSERKVADIRFTGAGPTSLAPSWTADGKWLVVADLGATDAENGIFLIPVESGSRQAIVTAPRATVRYGAPKVSPTGSHLAYVHCLRAGGGCDVWVQPLGANFTRAGDPRQLTALNGIVTGLAWMPDGSSLVVGITTTQRALAYLWRVPTSGATPTRLDWAGSSLFSPSVSSIGQRLVAERDLSTLDIWRFDVSSTGPPSEHPVSSTLPDNDPEFSPDGTKIAFASVRSGQEAEIWIAGSDGSNVMQLTRGASGRNRGSPRWSHDGKRIVFDSSSEDGVRRTYVIDSTGGEPRLVSDAPANFPSWSPDDRWIYFGSSRAGRTEVWRAPVDGGGAPEQVTTEGGTAPRVSSDGRTLYYRRGTTIFARPLAGGAERQIVEGTIGTSGSYLPFGNEVFYVARPDASRPTALELRAIDVRTAKTRTISRFDATAGQGLTVSPDGKTALLAVLKISSDLMLVESFQ